MVVILDGHGDENVGACYGHAHEGQLMREGCRDSYGRAQGPCSRVLAWRRRPLLYVCAPWMTRTQAEAEATEHVLRVAVTLGWAPIFAPYCFSRVFSDDAQSRPVLLSCAEGIIQKCDAFYRVGKRITEGMAREITFWQESVYCPWPIFDSLGGPGALPDIVDRYGE